MLILWEGFYPKMKDKGSDRVTTEIGVVELKAAEHLCCCEN